MHATTSQRWRVSVVCICILILVGCGPDAGSSKHGTPVRIVTANASLPALNPFPNAPALDSYLNQQVAKGVLSGSVLVEQNGMLFSKDYNLADVDARIPNTPQTRFRIGSNTKQFTAMAILILQDRGKLHVQDHICRYIPACPADWQPITIAELLTHSSGIPDYTNFPDLSRHGRSPPLPRHSSHASKICHWILPPARSSAIAIRVMCYWAILLSASQAKRMPHFYTRTFLCRSR